MTLRVLAGLVAGFLLGLALNAASPAASAAAVSILTPVGTIFVNLIRMAVIPLVVSILIVNAGRAGELRVLGRAGARALIYALALLAAAATAGALISQAALSRIAAPVASGPAPSSAAAASPPTLSAWLIDLVPQNVFKAAADGAMLPLILFAVLLGLALAQVDASRRDPVLRVVDGIAEAMQQLVGWILWLAPLGVFALAVPLASKFGAGAAGALIAYVVLVVALTIAAVGLMLYPLGVLLSPLGARGFVDYCAPSQAIGFASRSSLATLPVMMKSAQEHGMTKGAAPVILPLALTVFHFGSAVAQAVGVVFLANLYGVPLGVAQIAAVVAAVVLATFAVPGIPGGSIIAMVPVLAAAGVPADGLGILLAVDTIPDMFRTTANITGALTLGAIVTSSERTR